jgi:hypothetical protein
MRRWFLGALILCACTRTNPSAVQRTVAAPHAGGHPSLFDMSAVAPVDFSGVQPVDLAGLDFAGASPPDLAKRPADLAGSGLGIRCGAVVCPLGQGCCTADNGVTGDCVSDPNTCPTTSALLGCDGPEDCTGGALCCTTNGTDYNCTLTVLCLGGSLCDEQSQCGATAKCCPIAPGSPYRKCASACN